MNEPSIKCRCGGEYHKRFRQYGRVEFHCDTCCCNVSGPLRREADLHFRVRQMNAKFPDGWIYSDGSVSFEKRPIGMATENMPSPINRWQVEPKPEPEPENPKCPYCGNSLRPSNQLADYYCDSCDTYCDEDDLSEAVDNEALKQPEPDPTVENRTEFSGPSGDWACVTSFHRVDYSIGGTVDVRWWDDSTL